MNKWTHIWLLEKKEEKQTQYIVPENHSIWALRGTLAIVFLTAHPILALQLQKLNKWLILANISPWTKLKRQLWASFAGLAYLQRVCWKETFRGYSGTWVPVLSYSWLAGWAEQSTYVLGCSSLVVSQMKLDCTDILSICALGLHCISISVSIVQCIKAEISYLLPRRHWKTAEFLRKSVN